MVLLLVCLHLYAAGPVSTWNMKVGHRTYFAIVKNEAEASSDRLEGAEGICGVTDSAEQQFGGGGCGRLPVGFSLVRRSVQLGAFTRVELFRYVISRSRSGICDVGRSTSTSAEKQRMVTYRRALHCAIPGQQAGRDEAPRLHPCPHPPRSGSLGVGGSVESR
jgi:hypothetical protein